MTDNATTLILKGKIGYEEVITAAQAAQIIIFLSAEGGGAPAIGEPLQAPKESGREGSTNRIENPREAIQCSGAKTNAEKIVALAAYILQDGGDTVKPDAIKSQFQRAREVVPSRFTRDLTGAITSGWIAEDAVGDLYLTKNVEGIFEEGFVFPKTSASSRTRTSKGAKARTGKPESLDGLDSFESTMAGYLPYSKMKGQKERLLWVLVYMRDAHGRSNLTNKEIEWLTDHIGTGIPNSNISGAFNSARDGGFAIRSTQDRSIKVTDSGAEHLAKLGDVAEA